MQGQELLLEGMCRCVGLGSDAATAAANKASVL